MYFWFLIILFFSFLNKVSSLDPKIQLGLKPVVTCLVLLYISKDLLNSLVKSNSTPLFSASIYVLVK